MLPFMIFQTKAGFLNRYQSPKVSNFRQDVTMRARVSVLKRLPFFRPYDFRRFHTFGSSNANCSLAEPISMMERSSMMVGSFTVLPLSLGLARPVIWAI